MNRALRRALSPLQSACEIATRIYPEAYWKRYNSRARSAGFHHLYLTFSLDCDTELDAGVVLDLDQRLRHMGIEASYAVPGECLEESYSTYSQLLERGADFLNHGYRTHTHWNPSRKMYESTFFYDQAGRSEVLRDIVKGHDCLRSFLGRSPVGFRTPHFGTFQRRGQLKFLHRKLRELGYCYSSSTSPIYAFLHGPVVMHSGIYEIPVSGIATRPWQVYDSWGFFAAPHRCLRPKDYSCEAEKMVRIASLQNLVGVFNYYADPSHIWNQKDFFAALETLLRKAIPIKLEKVPFGQSLCFMEESKF